jgi:signal transduction histidine kinase
LGELAVAFNQMNRDLARQRGLRRQMTADIAHDLRTPLSIILGHAEALSEGVLPPTPESLHIIHDEAKRLNRLVEDLRTLSLADAGELPLVKRLVSPVTLLERARQAHTPQAAQKGIRLEMMAAPDLPAVSVDSDRMAQVLDNLLANALRFTPLQGLVTLSARKNGPDVEISVADNGPGMETAELAHLFDRFYRGDKARQREPDGGSGLGLAIARSIVAGHDGRIWAESAPGEGARFILTLPANSPADEGPIAP